MSKHVASNLNLQPSNHQLMPSELKIQYSFLQNERVNKYNRRNQRSAVNTHFFSENQNIKIGHTTTKQLLTEFNPLTVT